MKNWLWEIQQRAAKDKKISANAFRLLFLICSRWPRTCGVEPFKLSVADVAEWLGFSRESDHTGERAISELLRAGILVKRGCVGSPPTNLFLVFKSGQPTGIKSGQVTGNKSGQPTGNKSGQPTGNKSGQPTGNLISNSLREEIEANGRKSSSLRSKVTKGKQVPPAAGWNEALAKAAKKHFAQFKKKGLA